MTFNVINDGDPVLASPVMQNWRDTNYGSNLTPKSSTGADVDGTLDVGKTDAHWRDAWFGDGTNVVFRVDSTNQRAGVGISVPGADFQVVGSSGSSKIWIGNYTSDDCYAMFYNSGNIFSVGVDHSDNYKFKISDASVVGTNDRLVIDSAGNVGIGTSSPLPSPFNVFNGLHVDGSLTSTLIEGDTSAYLHFLDATGTTNQKIFEIVSGGQQTQFRGLSDALVSNYIFLSMGHSNGYVGIGMSSPSYLLDVATENSGSTNTSAIRNTSNTASSHATNLIETAGSSAGDPLLRLSISGTKNYYFGIDNSDSDYLKISRNSDLSNPGITMAGNAAGTGVAPVFIGTVNAAYFGVQNTFDGSDLVVQIQNDGSSTGSNTQVNIRTLAGDGNTILHFDNISADFYCGCDGSDSGHYKISRSSDLSSESMEIEDATGIVNFPLGITATNPRCSVYHASNTTITGTTTINWDSEDYDNDSMHDTVTNNNRITVNENGVYTATINADITTSGAPSNFTEWSSETIAVNINLKNSGGTILQQWTQLMTNISATINVTGTYDCSATDYFECTITETTPDTITLLGGDNISFFTVHKTN